MNWENTLQFLVKEHVGFFKASSNYDIFTLDTNTPILECREEKIGIITKVLRFTDYASMTPFNVEIRDMNGQVLVEISRGISLLRSTVTVKDGTGRVLGFFRQKLMSIGGKFSVLDAQEQEFFTLQGKWTGWDFKFLRDSVEYAHISKKWAGMGKEFFTTADNYVLDINSILSTQTDTKKLILAAVMCIDKVFKE